MMTRRSALAAALAPLARATAPAGQTRVLLTTGGHSHDFSFYSIFEEAKDLAVTVDGHPSVYRRDLRQDCDVLVLYDLADVNEPQRQKNLRDFVEAGKGIVALHHAIADNQQWPWWYEEVIGGRYVLKAEANQAGSTYKHDVDLNVLVSRKHPITAGIDNFRINDETYKGMWISPKVQVLLTTKHETSDGPLAWIGPHEKARVVYIQLGHGPLAHKHPAYRRLVRQAIAWAAAKA